MQAEVTEDQTVRTITLNIQDVPDIDTTQPWHRAPMMCRPYQAVLTVVNGKATVIEVTGWRVLRSGVSTQLYGQFEWHADGPREREQIESAPKWVRLIWEQAPAGRTSWDTDV